MGRTNPTPGRARRRKTPDFNPDADATECAECGATIEIDDDESVMDAVIAHFNAAGHFSD
jgi:hypothetical protein